MVDKTDFETRAGYVLGLASIILALSFVSPVGGLVAGILGLQITNKQTTELSKKARKFSKIGIITSAIILILLIVFAFYIGTNSLQNFPAI